MTARRRRLGTAIGVVVLAASTLALPTTPAAGYGTGGRSEQTGNCVAYATGSGMGSYCLGGGGGQAQTLRERFGKQRFDRCRFTKPPASMDVPFNPGGGEWWVRSCINYIDWDTVSGGPGRQLNIHLAFLPPDFDTSYDASPLSEYLWNQVETTTQFPVPFLRPRPTAVPRVGVPAYMTFRWIAPEDRSLVAEGPYVDEQQGGPFIQIENPNGLLMRARAIRMRLDPLQNDLDQVVCSDVNPQYDFTKGPSTQEQTSDCYVTYKRSSATAAERMTTDRRLPESLGPVYILRVLVDWEVEYSRDGEDWTLLGRGGTGAGADQDLVQITEQPLPVREAQAANVPPRISLS